MPMKAMTLTTYQDNEKLAVELQKLQALSSAQRMQLQDLTNVRSPVGIAIIVRLLTIRHSSKDARSCEERTLMFSLSQPFGECGTVSSI